ncbi:DUF4760 domain-containing protein [Pelagibacterium luteolum]|uniref:DUF4760 domain-containing protein n=1 Tax=Pelagibacterium luteolum TaxID=440168 RepID=A0A1G7TFX9_9HYPH|nr:DUF4760 domain-containing protein [Pelagibacterium luteolum]SDG34267.1 protein of unknown function [Pelagibacterium luteolum]
MENEAVSVIASGPGVPWAIFISAGAVLIAAAAGAYWQRRISRQVLTFNNIVNLLWDEDYIKARQKFIALRDGENGQLTALAQAAKRDSDEAGVIAAILNDYEIVSIGVLKGVMDEKMMKRFYRSTVISDYDKIKPFIDEVRRVDNNQKLFSEFETLAERWRRKP